MVLLLIYERDRCSTSINDIFSDIVAIFFLVGVVVVAVGFVCVCVCAVFAAYILCGIYKIQVILHVRFLVFSCLFPLCYGHIYRLITAAMHVSHCVCMRACGSGWYVLQFLYGWKAYGRVVDVRFSSTSVGSFFVLFPHKWNCGSVYY